MSENNEKITKYFRAKRDKVKKISILVPEKKPSKKILIPDFGILKNDLKLIQDYLKKCKNIIDNKNIPNLLYSNNKSLESIIRTINSFNGNNFNEEQSIINTNQLLKQFNCSNEKELLEKIGQENKLYNTLIININQLFILLNSILDINDNDVKETKSFFTNFELLLDNILEKYSNDKEIITQINSKRNFEEVFSEEYNNNSDFYKCIKQINHLYLQMNEKIIDIFIDLIVNVLNYNSDNLSKIKSSVHSKIANFQENFTLLRGDIEEVFKNMKKQNENLNQKIIQLNKQIKDKEEQNENLNQKIIQLNEQIKEKEEQNENLNQIILQLNEQIKEEEQQNEFLNIITEENNNRTNKNNNLQTILNQIKEENLEFLNKINEFRENKNKNLEFEIKKKDEEINEVLAINKKYSIKIKTLEKENKCYKNIDNKDIKKLTEEFNKINNELLDHISLEKKNDLEKMNQLQENINNLNDEIKYSKDLEKILLTKINALNTIKNINE